MNTERQTPPSPASPISAAVLILLFLFLSTLAALGFVLFHNAALMDTIAAQDAQIQILRHDLLTLDAAPVSETTPPTDIAEKAREYEHICRSLENSVIGFSSSNFRAYDSIILLNQSEKNRKTTLVAHWDEGGHVTASYSSSHATVSFDEETWDTSTTLTVHPHSPGATVVTFSNSVNAKQFKILIIVTE